MLTPWRHQKEAREFVRQLYASGRRGAMLAMDMGTGKTRVAIDVAGDLAAERILILCPLRVVEVWRDQLRQYAALPYEVAVLDDRVDGATKKTLEAKRLLAWAEERQRPLAIAINYESARVEPFASWSLKNIWPLVIADECVPAGTKISTPDNGDKPIETLNAGDMVLGYDHAADQIVETAITHTFHSTNTGPRYSVGATVMTPKHPVWTANRGYVPVSELQESDYVIEYKNSELRMVRLHISKSQTTSPLLQPKVLSQVAHVTTGIRKNAQYGTTATDIARKHEQAAPTTRSDPKDSSSFGLKTQPNTETRDQEESNRNAQSYGFSAINWRQRSRAHGAPATPFRCPARISNGISGPHGHKAECAESGFSDAGNSASNRGGWRQPSVPAGQSTRSEERTNPGQPRLDPPAFLELANSQSSTLRNHFDPADNRVFNIETGTGNYFANGLLVHNCHRIKEPGGRTSRYCFRLGLCAHHRLGLTGTPMPHQPIDIWSQFRFLDQTILDPTFGSFKLRHAVMGGYYDKQIVDWKDLDDLYRRFRKIAFRVNSDVLDLPEELDQILSTDLSESAAQIYRSMEEEMVAWLSATEMVTAKNALVRLLRLQQITGGSLPDEQGQARLIDQAKENLLSEFLSDIGTEPVVVFAKFKPDLAAIHRAAAHNELRSAELSGEKDELDVWKRARMHDPTVLAVQIQAGGVGIDLTRARLAVYYSIGYSLGDYVQSRARIRRPPQTRPCVYYHLQVRHSIDEIVLRAVLARQDLIAETLRELRAPRSVVYA